MTDPLKDLSKLKDLFPDMEPIAPETSPVNQKAPVTDLPDASKAKMKLYVSRDKKHRGGKQVTLVQGHEGPKEIMEALLSGLKSLCSAGGSLKEGELIIQGDHVKKVITYLLAAGYKQTKQKGG